MSKRINKSEGYAAAAIENIFIDGIEARDDCPVGVLGSFPEVAAFLVVFRGDVEEDNMYFRVHPVACDENGEAL